MVCAGVSGMLAACTGAASSQCMRHRMLVCMILCGCRVVRFFMVCTYRSYAVASGTGCMVFFGWLLHVEVSVGR